MASGRPIQFLHPPSQFINTDELFLIPVPEEIHHNESRFLDLAQTTESLFARLPFPPIEEGISLSQRGSFFEDDLKGLQEAFQRISLHSPSAGSDLRLLKGRVLQLNTLPTLSEYIRTQANLLQKEIERTLFESSILTPLNEEKREILESLIQCQNKNSCLRAINSSLDFLETVAESGSFIHLKEGREILNAITLETKELMKELFNEGLQRKGIKNLFEEFKQVLQKAEDLQIAKCTLSTGNKRILQIIRKFIALGVFSGTHEELLKRYSELVHQIHSLNNNLTSLTSSPFRFLENIHKMESPEKLTLSEYNGMYAFMTEELASSEERKRALQRASVLIALGFMISSLKMQQEDVVKGIFAELDTLVLQEKDLKGPTIPKRLFHSLYQCYKYAFLCGHSTVNPDDPYYQGCFGEKAFAFDDRVPESTVRKIAAIQVVFDDLIASWMNHTKTT